MGTLSDESLLAGFASGDTDASAAFVRRFQSRVYGLALTILRDRELADDAAQEAFLRAWRYAPSYDARRGAVATWLLAIARNVAIDIARVKPATPVEPDVVASELDLADSDALPDLPERERVRQAVATLPADQRRALELVLTSGRRLPLPALAIDATRGSAGHAIPVDLHDVAAVRFVGRAGDVLQATLSHGG